MVTPLWPRNVLPPQVVQFDIAARTLAGPSSISGVAQVVASDAGIWAASFDRIIVRKNSTAVLALRALSALLEGRLHPVLVPLCGAYQPFGDDKTLIGKQVPHSDLSPFSDRSLYENGYIDFRLISNIPLRGTMAMLRLAVGAVPQPGQHFSIGERLYRIRTVEMRDDKTVQVTFRPPAREAVSIGTHIEFDQPVCRMRLASDGELAINLDMTQPYNYHKVSFIEDV